jgi:hypothetical protein
MFGKKRVKEDGKALIGLIALTGAPWPNAGPNRGNFSPKKIWKCPVRFLELGETLDLLRKRRSRSVRETFKISAMVGNPEARATHYGLGEG